MRIALIGAGNLATRLGVALVESGHDVLQVYSRTGQSASELGALLHTKYVTSFHELCTDADIYIVALKDSVLSDLIPQIVEGREKALFVHTAGSMPASLWKGSAERYGVFYPMQTFSKQRETDFSVIPIFVEATNEEDSACLKLLASSLSRKVFEATSEQRRVLHLSAVFACNFTNYMYSVCEHLLQEAGLPFESMLPLIDETAAKVHVLQPSQAQTGPAVRNDDNVMAKHLEMLEKYPNWQDLYEQISKNIYYDKLRFDQD